MRPLHPPKGLPLAKALIFGLLFGLLGLVPASRAQALRLGAGLMFGGTYSWVSENVETSSQSTGGGTYFGLIFEQRFEVPNLLLETFEDFQPVPIGVQTGSATQTAGYLPVDAGLRLGWAQYAVQPYLAAILQGLFLTGHPVGGAPLKQAAFGVGGALGVDLAIFFVRLGLEFRITETVTDLSPSGSSPDPGNVAIFQGLFSLRSDL